MDLAAEYNNSARVPGHQAIFDAWRADATSFRRTAAADLDVAYGARPRNRLDLFHGSSPGSAPLVVFIHGGYWRSFDKSAFSHLARGAVSHGLSVALPSYSLCPDVTLPDIIDELRQCCLHLWRTTGRRLVVSGHSAGGHLAACLALTGWPAYGAPADLIAGAVAISGLFDLRPLLAIPLNADLRLTPAQALAASPLAWPVTGALPPVEAWVGGEESSEFLRQTRSLVAAFQGMGQPVEEWQVTGANHFTVVSPLADPDSPHTARLARLASG